MIYFIRGVEGATEIACAETIERAAILYAQGWRKVDRDIWMAWWIHFDNLRLWELRTAIAARRLTRMRARVAGEMY